MHIGEKTIGNGEPAFILAEIASAHQGDASRALRLASSATDSGADGVKFQLFRAGRLIAPNDDRRPVFDQIELSMGEWEKVLGAAGALDLPLIGEIFDEESLDLAERYGLAAYKIHSTDMENPELIRRVAATGKPMLFSTGGSRLETVDDALAAARSECNEDLMLLHGVQNFPTRAADSHLRTIETLKRRFGLPVGFLDHVDGGSPFALVLPALAIAFGADLVEKHVTLDRSAKGFDYESALEPEAFRSMVELIRQSESAFGEPALPSGESASRYHRLMRRAALASADLPQGEPIRGEQLAFLRSETGLSPRDADRLVGRKPRRDIAAWEPLTEDLFE